MTKPTFFKPYPTLSDNQAYNRLFCDDLSLYRASPEEYGGEDWKQLLGPRPGLEQLQRLAEQEDLPARLRILAFNSLLKKGSQPARRELLGFILEGGVDDGLETLAAYTDYSLIFIEPGGRQHLWDVSQPPRRDRLIKCFSSATALAAQLKPTDQPRFSPPFSGMARVTLLLSDGRYFGQGPGHHLTKDPLSGPLIKQANSLLTELLNSRTKS